MVQPQLVNPLDQITSVATRAGSVSAVNTGADCGSSEAALTFNQKGPAGPAGQPARAAPPPRTSQPN